MTVNDEKGNPASFSKQAARLRRIGVLVLLLGIGSAGMVYWKGTYSADSTDDPLSAEYSQSQSRAQARQMGLLYGKMGTLIEDLSDDLKRPGTQAALIAVLSTLVAAGCFYFARPPEAGE